jgi:hypothetical protein
MHLKAATQTPRNAPEELQRTRQLHRYVQTQFAHLAAAQLVMWRTYA